MLAATFIIAAGQNPRNNILEEYTVVWSSCVADISSPSFFPVKSDVVVGTVGNVGMD